MPRSRPVAGRARAADLQLQLAARGVPAVHRARVADGDRPGPRRARSEPLHRRGRDRAVDGQRVRLLRPAHAGDRRALRRRPRDAVGGPAGGGARLLPVRHERRAGPGLLPQPVRAAATLRDDVRRNHPEPRAPLPRDGLGLLPREDRGVHDAAALPGVQRRAAAPRVPRRLGSRHPDPRVHGAVGQARARMGSRPRAD